MFRNNSILLLLAITFLAAILRYYKLDQYPVSLNWDEVSHGYNAYSILKTGHDEWGEILPFIFRAFGDYKLPVYIYSTIVPIFIFGLNAFAVRFISALAGTLAIPGIYLLTNSLFPDKKIKLGKIEVSLGHLAAFVLTLMPWHIFISRPALEATLALTLIIFVFYFLPRALERSTFYIPASLFLGLSLHTYNTQRVFVPLLVIIYSVLYRKQIKYSRRFSYLYLLSPYRWPLVSASKDTTNSRYSRKTLFFKSAKKGKAQPCLNPCQPLFTIAPCILPHQS